MISAPADAVRTVPLPTEVAWACCSSWTTPAAPRTGRAASGGPSQRRGSLVRREGPDLVPSDQPGTNACVVQPPGSHAFIEAVKNVGAFRAVLNESPCGSKPPF